MIIYIRKAKCFATLLYFLAYSGMLHVQLFMVQSPGNQTLMKKQKRTEYLGHYVYKMGFST